MSEAAVLPEVFARLQANPTAFDPLTALRVAQAEAERRGLPLDIRAAAENRLAPGPVSAVTVEEDAIVVIAPLIGLTGALSPLPPPYTEMAAREKRGNSGAFSAFIDLFTHELTRLFAAASAKYNFADLLQWARPEKNRVLQAVRALIGFGTEGLEDHAPLPEDATLRYAGLFAQRTRTAIGLERLAQTQLGLPVKIEQFRPHWYALPAEEQTQLDGTVRLADAPVAGANILDRSGQCRLVIGPLRYADFLSLEVGQPRLTDLARLVRLYLGPVMSFDMQIILDRRDIPMTQLGGDGPPARLGWNTWAKAEAATHDSEEAVIDGERALEMAA